jgi:hypothetical protein
MWRSQLTFGFEKGRRAGSTSRPRMEDDTETNRTVLGRTTEEKHNECIISSWQGEQTEQKPWQI